MTAAVGAATTPAQSTVQKKGKSDEEEDHSIENIAAKAMEQVDQSEARNAKKLTESAIESFKDTQS